MKGYVTACAFDLLKAIYTAKSEQDDVLSTEYLTPKEEWPDLVEDNLLPIAFIVYPESTNNNCIEVEFYPEEFQCRITSTGSYHMVILGSMVV